MTPCIDGAACDDDGRVSVFLIVIASKRHEEAAFGVGIDGIIPLASCNDGATVEFDACVGIDGIVGRIDVHGASIDNDSILAFNAFGSSSGCLHGHGTAVDGDFPFRCNTFSGSYILVLACKAHASAFLTIFAVFIGSTETTEVWEATKTTLTCTVIGFTTKAWETSEASEVGEAAKSTLTCAVVGFTAKAWETTEASEVGKAAKSTLTCAVVGFTAKAWETSEATEIRESSLWHLEIAEIGHFAASKTTEVAKTVGFLPQMVAGGGYVEGEVFDGDVLLGFDASAAITSGNDIEGAFTGEEDFVF